MTLNEIIEDILEDTVNQYGYTVIRPLADQIADAITGTHNINNLTGYCTKCRSVACDISTGYIYS